MEPPPIDGFVVTIADGRPSRLETPKPEQALAGARRADLAWVNIEVEDLERDAETVAQAMGFGAGLVETILRLGRSEYEDRDVELGLATPIVRVDGLEVSVTPLLLLVRENFVLTMYKKGGATRFRKFERYAETAMRKMPANRPLQDKLTILVTRLLDENNARNFEGIRPIEDAGEALAGELVSETADRRAIGPRIYQMKRALINYLDALWAAVEPIQALRHGDAELISDDEALLARISLLDDEIQRHIQLSEHISEVLSGGLEVMQSIYNNQLQALNNRMAFIVTWLTVLGTAVLVPNTLATVISAAPLGLHIEDPGLYAAVMVGSTAFATMGAWVWVKLKVPIPKKLD